MLAFLAFKTFTPPPKPSSASISKINRGVMLSEAKHLVFPGYSKVEILRLRLRMTL
jgi:hypothetical protein